MTAVVASSAMHRIFAAATSIAGSGSAVLITGETGTGKELIARAAHHYSVRAGKPFIDVKGAAVPDHCFDIEPFGQNGANGLFGAAHGGTLFLDESHDLPDILLNNGGVSGRLETSDSQDPLGRLERKTIRRVVVLTGGHQRKAADLLGISRLTLIRKLTLYRALDRQEHASMDDKYNSEPKKKIVA